MERKYPYFEEKILSEVLKCLLNIADYGLMILDRDSNILFINDKIIKMYEDKDMIRKLSRENEGIKRIFVNGKNLFVKIEKIPFRDFIFVVHKDLSETLFLREHIISNIDHEFKTPITIIKAVVEELIEESANLSKEFREMLNIAKRNIHRLLELVDNMLAVKSLINERFKINKAIINLKKVAEDTASEKKKYAKEKNVSVYVEAKPVHIVGDRILIKCALLNLIDNAIKFNRDGGKVFIRIFKEDKNAVLIVEDTGIGFPQEKLSLVFEPFFQLDPTIRRKHGGIGLGLYIVKRVIEIHGGHINVKSSPDRGSEFVIRLPAVV